MTREEFETVVDELISTTKFYIIKLHEYLINDDDDLKKAKNDVMSEFDRLSARIAELEERLSNRCTCERCTGIKVESYYED